MIKVITLMFLYSKGSIIELAHAGPYDYLIWQFCVNSSLEFTLLCGCKFCYWCSVYQKHE
jgi:hypothetical protein